MSRGHFRPQSIYKNIGSQNPSLPANLSSPTKNQEMAKVHPNAPPSPSIESPPVNVTGKEETMTVWRKSLLFNCKGFTVYDSNGNLAFRVDNYSTRRGNSQILLMDATGLPLFTIKRKRLNLRLGLGDSWLIYQGEQTKSPLFAVDRHVTIRHSKSLGHVTPCRGSTAGQRLPRYAIEGSYSQRCCTVYDEQQQQRKAVAEIQRKDAAAPGATLGGDVFRLVVRPGFDGSLAMAIVLLLDQMFGS